MALQPIAALIQSSDCTQLFLTDNTGSYNSVSNAGGYGTPNPTVAQVTSATLSGTIFLPAGTTIIIPLTTLFPTSITPIFNSNQAWILTTALLGINGNTFPDGIYVLNYTVNGTSGSSFSITYTFQQMITCNADCCIGNVLSDLDPCDCGCKEVCEAFEMYGLLQGAKAACGGTMNSKSLDMLNVVSNWCAKQSGCGCT